VALIYQLRCFLFRSQGQKEGLPAAIHPGAEAESGGVGAAGAGCDRDARPQGARCWQDRARALRSDRPAKAALRPAKHQDRRGRRAPHVLARVAPLPQTCPRPPLRRPSALDTQQQTAQNAKIILCHTVPALDLSIFCMLYHFIPNFS
jgi:hypothetical protein